MLITVLLILALVLFLLAAIDFPSGKSINLIAGGLFCSTLALLAGQA